MKNILLVITFLCVTLSSAAQEDTLRYRKNDGSIMAFPRSEVDYEIETSDAYKVRISAPISDVERVTFNRVDGSIHPQPPYEHVDGEMPCYIDGQVMATISTNSEALPGGAIIIKIVSRELIERVYIAVSGQPGYDIKYPDSPTYSGGEYVYRIPVMFPQDWDYDVMVKIGGHTADGRTFTCEDLPVRYHKAGTGALQVSLSFDNAKDIDLHLYTPSGIHYYWENKGGYITIDGQRVRYGLDVDSNANCNPDNMDGKNAENITLPEEKLEAGTYRVFVNMYKNCDESIATGWTCVTTRGGQLVENQISGKGNPASGVYPVGHGRGDMTEVMRFNVELSSASRFSKQKKYVITPIPLDDSAIMKMEEEKTRIGE